MEVIRIILAEADLGAQALTRTFFEEQADMRLCGMARDGYETLALVERMAPQVLLLSLALPGLDGLAVLRHLRTLLRPPMVVVLSPFSDQRVMEYALSLGARYYLIKPISYRDLPHTLRGLLDEGEETRATRLLLGMLTVPGERPPKAGKGLQAAASAATALARAAEEMLLKEAYYETITTQHTDYACVEKNIRYLVGRIHQIGGEPYRALMGGLPPTRPDNDTFLRRLAQLLKG